MFCMGIIAGWCYTGNYAAAVSWARGEGAEQEGWQSVVLQHMARTQGGPLPPTAPPPPPPSFINSPPQVSPPAAPGWLAELRQAGDQGGGLAALTAISFNGRKKATTPVAAHAWTLCGWDGTGGARRCTGQHCEPSYRHTEDPTLGSLRLELGNVSLELRNVSSELRNVTFCGQLTQGCSRQH